MRRNWQVGHDYADVLALGREIARVRDPRHILFYIPGWQGAYDSGNPTYRPHPELGGEDAFRGMMDGLHGLGFHVMVHTTASGLDPYHPDIDELLALADRRDGRLYGWQIDETGLPHNRPVRFPDETVSLARFSGRDAFSFRPPPAPEYCEALLTLGGVPRTEARVHLSVERRTIKTPPGWFARHGEFDFPFPLNLEAGDNEVRVRVTGGEVDWRGAWCRVRKAFTMAGPYTSWTWPILQADGHNPEYVRLFCTNVRDVVREFGIDAVHLDALVFEEARGLFLALRDALPGVPLAAEWLGSVEGMNEITFCQNARQSLLRYDDLEAEQSALPVRGLAGLGTDWSNTASPVCRFAEDYLLVYPHLCAANAFVPVGKVCNIMPPRRIPEDTGEHWRVLRDARRLGYLPGLRVNFRRYGLDEDSRKALAEL
jgi:hypothetical protein